MDHCRRTHKTTIVATVAVVAGATFATSGCSIFNRRANEPMPVPDSPAFTSQVSTNENDLPLPVEINQDIGRIAAGGSHFEAGGSGKVNVNVNVNFGQGWQQNLPNGSQNGSPSRQPTSVNQGGVTESFAGGGGGGSNAAVLPVGDMQHRAGAEKYVVKAGDTLMKISFEKFGNVYRWREILASNQGRIPNSQALVAGTELTIDGTDYVVVERNGTPYLIVRNDTLGKISRHVYGTPSFWRDLWKNNPQLIHNPNKIYSGFTLYYRDKSELGAPVNVGKADKNEITSTKRLPASRKKTKKPVTQNAPEAESPPAVTAKSEAPASASAPALQPAAPPSRNAKATTADAPTAAAPGQWQANPPPRPAGGPSISEQLEQPTAEAFPPPVAEPATK